MVVGDIINGISALNTILDHIPAAGVEEIVMTMHADGTNNDPALRDAGGLDSILIANGTLERNTNQGSLKMGITNAIFLRISALGAGNSSAFSAIQVQ